MINDCLDQILKEADDCYSNSDYTAAAQQIEKAVDQQPENAEFWATWGNIQFQAGAYPSAIEKYQQATKFAPEIPDYWTYLALAFFICFLCSFSDIGLKASRLCVPSSIKD